MTQVTITFQITVPPVWP